MDKVFVCGGMYSTHNAEKPFEFGLVRPTKGLPYVARTEEAGKRLFNLCQHHSHLYTLDVETGTVKLVQSGGENGVKNTAPATLPLALKDEVKAQIAAGNFAGEF